MIENFTPFSAEHLFLLLVIVFLSVFFLLIARMLSTKQEFYLRFIFCCTIWGQEITLYAYRYTEGTLSLSEHLPLHMCSLSVLLIPIMLFHKGRRISSLLYFWGMGGATQALLTPTVTSQTPSFLFVQFFTSHAFIIIGVLYPIVVHSIRPSA